MRQPTPFFPSRTCRALLLVILVWTLAACGQTTTPQIATNTPAAQITTETPLALTPVVGATTAAPTATFAASPSPAPATPTLSSTPTAAPTIASSPSPEASQTVRFAVIGDYGQDSAGEERVAALVKSWNPDFIITVGDNNYPAGEAATIDANIGKYYHEYIGNYHGQYGPGSETNRFFPALGNHDWLTPGAAPYLNYFTLPGNERYYDFVEGTVHFFALDTDPNEPDKVGISSTQAAWLKAGLASAKEPWKIVYGHHPAYSSGPHGPTDYIAWPFKEWGATTYLSGHDHIYERIMVNGFPYFVNGLGGESIYNISSPISGSEVRYNASFGAMLVEADSTSIRFQFYNINNELIDEYSLNNQVAYSPVLSVSNPVFEQTQGITYDVRVSNP